MSAQDDDQVPPLEIVVEIALPIENASSPTDSDDPVVAAANALLEARRANVVESLAIINARLDSAREDARLPLLTHTETVPTRGGETDRTNQETAGVPVHNTDDASTSTSVQPILSSIRDLRSALHERVLNLGHEVERLRARAAAVERGFADNRRQRMIESRMPGGTLDSPWDRDETELEAGGSEQGDPGTTWSMSALVNRFSASQPSDMTRDREEGKYEIVKGSGSSEIEGSKEERRQKRLHQVKVESTRLESKASLDALRRRVGNLSTRPSEVPSSETTPAVSAISTPVDRPVLQDILSRNRTFAIPPASGSADRSLTTRGLRVQNAQSSSTANEETTAEINRRYRNALMNRPVPPANIGPRPPTVNGRIFTNNFTEEMEQNITRLQRMVQDARVLQDRQRAASENIESTTGEAALDRARENVQELRTLHTMLENLYTRFDAARSSLVPTSRLRATPPAVPAASTTAAAVSRPRSRTARPTLARRPSPPFLRSSAHPYFRPRIGIEPIAAVLNIDNLNSFELHFDGNVVFRPIARRTLEPELVARCLSMLPGGREDTPSRWMRLIGDTTSRPRRAEAWGGYWIRWVSEELFEIERPRQRRLDTDTLPKIIAFDISVTPPEDDAWVRSDESEFYTQRTRLRRHIGPWIHSRIRIAPYETDPADSPWGTSAHVRQAIRTVGRVRSGDFVRFKLDERVVTLVRAPSALAAPLTTTATDSLSRDTTDDVDASSTTWLNVYQPALRQITDYWQSHHRRVTNGESPSPLLLEAEEMAGGWGRDYLDANGVALPTATLARLTDLTNTAR